MGVEPNLGVGTGAAVTIEANDFIAQDGDDRTGFGTLLPADADGAITIVLVSTCSVSPGSTNFQIAESSTCHAQLHPTIRVTLTRTEG